MPVPQCSDMHAEPVAGEEVSGGPGHHGAQGQGWQEPGQGQGKSPVRQGQVEKRIIVIIFLCLEAPVGVWHIMSLLGGGSADHTEASTHLEQDIECTSSFFCRCFVPPAPPCHTDPGWRLFLLVMVTTQMPVPPWSRTHCASVPAPVCSHGCNMYFVNLGFTIVELGSAMSMPGRHAMPSETWACCAVVDDDLEEV